jgi:uncharacterized protein YdeI (YjbR/CyaY-like superfamily)
MGKRDARVDAYIEKSADFAKPILNHLRKLVHEGCPEVEESWKWSFPHFMHKGILCSMAAFKNHCAFGFWKGALVTGKNDGAEDLGEEAMGQFGRISAISDLPSEKVLLGYIKEATRLNDEGIKKPTPAKPKTKKELVIPSYFTAALKKNPKAQATFEKFSYSHKKEYVEWVTEAKREETRNQRLATALDWLEEGKSRHWKYANC